MNLKNTTLVFLFVFLSSFVFGQDLSNGLVLDMMFNGDAADLSGAGYDGIVSGATPTQDRFGNADAAYYFDGIDDYIEIPHSDTIKPDMPLSFSMWVYFEDSIGDNITIFANNDGPSIYYGITLNILVDHRVSISTGDGRGAGSQYRRSLFSTDTLPANTWNHIVGIMRGDVDMDLYINGQKDTASYYGGSGLAMAYDSLPGYIGTKANPWGDPRFFRGILDDVKMWGCALDSAEVQELYNAVVSTGIFDETPEFQGKVYPNPVTDKLYIELEGLQTVVVRNQLGQSILTAHGQHELDLSELPAGVYVATFETRDGKAAGAVRILKP